MFVSEDDYRHQAREAIRSRVTTDANETYLLEREITLLRAKVIRKDYPDLKGRLFAPKATDIPAGSTIYSYKEYNRTGRARISANGGKGAPRVDIQGTEVKGSVVVIDASYGYTFRELKQAAKSQFPLTAEKGEACRLTVETGVDEMLAFGDLELSTGQANVRCTGLLNNATVEALGIIDPANDPWSGATGEQVLANINAMVNRMISDAAGVEGVYPDSIVFPTWHFAYIASTPFSSTIPTTILKTFLDTSPYIKNVSQWNRCDLAGASGKDRAVIYKRSSEVLEAVIPQEYEELPPQADEGELKVVGSMECGGIKVYRPLGMRYADIQRGT